MGSNVTETIIRRIGIQFFQIFFQTLLMTDLNLLWYNGICGTVMSRGFALNSLKTQDFGKMYKRSRSRYEAVLPQVQLDILNKIAKFRASPQRSTNFHIIAGPTPKSCHINVKVGRLFRKNFGKI